MEYHFKRIQERAEEEGGQEQYLKALWCDRFVRRPLPATQSQVLMELPHEQQIVKPKSKGADGVGRRT